MLYQSFSHFPSSTLGKVFVLVNTNRRFATSLPIGFNRWLVVYFSLIVAERLNTIPVLNIFH